MIKIVCITMMVLGCVISFSVLAKEVENTELLPPKMLDESKPDHVSKACDVFPLQLLLSIKERAESGLPYDDEMSMLSTLLNDQQRQLLAEWALSLTYVQGGFKALESTLSHLKYQMINHQEVVDFEGFFGWISNWIEVKKVTALPDAEYVQMALRAWQKNHIEQAVDALLNVQQVEVIAWVQQAQKYIEQRALYHQLQKALLAEVEQPIVHEEEA